RSARCRSRAASATATRTRSGAEPRGARSPGDRALPRRPHAMVTVGLALLIAVVAALYASVGLAGATGYLALMGLFGVDAGAMKPASLLLNAVVSVISTLVFARTPARPGGLFWPIVVPGVP